jgi:hypothetical protein
MKCSGSIVDRRVEFILKLLRTKEHSISRLPIPTEKPGVGRRGSGNLLQAMAAMFEWTIGLVQCDYVQNATDRGVNGSAERT